MEELRGRIPAEFHDPARQDRRTPRRRGPRPLTGRPPRPNRKATMQLRTRVSDGDRDMAVQRLQQAFADGRLGYGSATIVLPRGASANADGVRTEWGRVTCEAP